MTTITTGTATPTLAEAAKAAREAQLEAEANAERDARRRQRENDATLLQDLVRDRLGTEYLARASRCGYVREALTNIPRVMATAIDGLLVGLLHPGNSHYSQATLAVGTVNVPGKGQLWIHWMGFTHLAELGDVLGRFEAYQVGKTALGVTDVEAA